MELAQAVQIFDTLYQDVDGYRVSLRERAMLKLQQHRAATYGEILPESFLQMVQAAQPKEGEVFFDLGSGTGKPVFLAALAFPFSRAVGIELLAQMGAEARRVLERYRREVLPSL